MIPHFYRYMCGLTVGATLAGTVAVAHHSATQFDATKTLEVAGTFKQVQIGNPHSLFWVVVPNAEGGADLWSFETYSVAQLTKQIGGAAKDYLAPGQKVTVSFHPLRDGRKSGEMVRMVFEDGHVLGSPGDAPPASATP